ncbi:alpha/beta hydrolase [Streptomyces sp. CNQ085]|uniref:alpha/beta hydrolase n=1 Tax=Streptomyces sp. CNQ085 TaxID=2886944 RepID=UPI001F5072F2|nr:alpha/beta hydrolase [Streptomyces sp. CNQ085]MCI0385194.1 alpha/beta hydrolase [Streptomyces sp. CNQ085]
MNEIAVSTEQGVAYEPGGRLLDVHRPARVSAPTPTVLLWHGRGPEERDVLAPLARQAASLGLLVVVPDWRPDAPDGGWGHLRASVRFTRERAGEFGGDAGRIVLAGWSLGAYAAVSAAVRPELVDGWRPAAVAGIAGRYLWERPEMGLGDLRDALAATPAGPVPVHLVHGTADDIADVRHSRDFVPALDRWGWPVALTETDADHAGAVMTEYAPERQRCVPARAAGALAAGRTAARVLARAAGLPVPG